MYNSDKIQEQLIQFVKTKEVSNLLKFALVCPRDTREGNNFNPVFKIAKNKNGFIFEVTGVETNGTIGNFRSFYIFKDDEGITRTNIDELK